MLGKILGNVFGGANRKLKKVENKNKMEAIIGGGLLLAYADGEREDSEIDRLNKLVMANPNLSHFGHEITTTVNRLSALLDADYQVGRLAILKEIGDIKNNSDDCMEVFANILAVAKADGNIEPEEAAELKYLARFLAVNPSDFGLQL